MDDKQYEYLDEERKKLWAELRNTQSKLEVFVSTLSGDTDAIQTGIRSLGLKAAKAYNRIVERDSQLDDLSGNMASRLDLIKQAEKEATILNSSLAATNEKVADALSKIDDGLSNFDNSMGTLVKQSESVKECLEKAEQYIKKAEEVKSELQSQVEDISDNHEQCVKDYEEISKFHSLLFGYEKDDGEIVEGRKQKLENVYAELEQKIDRTKTDAEVFEKDYKRQCTDFLEEAKVEALAIANKIKGLLPDALTAGLSSAYNENRKLEEAEQKSQLSLFKWCIGGMMALALIPVALNLYLWIEKDFTVMQLLEKLPREMMCILPIYIPLFWMAIFANKRVNLSKRLIEEYKHKEAVSKTYEGLAKQISEIGDDNTSKELQARLLYNTVMLSEKNPGELIKNFNRPDNPLLDVLNQSSRFAEAVEKLGRVPGLSKLFQMAENRQKKQEKLASNLDESIAAAES
jgi:chromosome segregation ATPase